MSRKSKAAEFTDISYPVHVTGRNVLVTDAMKDYAVEKVSKIERFNIRIIDISVTMDIQRYEQKVDIRAKVNDLLILGAATTDNIYTSIDRAVEKLQAQLRKYKDKLEDHRAPPLEEIDMKVNVFRAPAEEEVFEINDQIEDENSKQADATFKQHEIVNQETRPLKTLTQDEALMKMDLSGESFCIFRNEQDRKINVIYKREDGDYGVIEVQ